MTLPDINEASELAEEGRTGRARELLDKLVGMVPTYLAAHILLARIAETEKRHEDALGHWQDAHFLAPMNALVKESMKENAIRVYLPEEKVQPAVTIPEVVDLDRLIEELESARIVPDPDIATIPAEELEDNIDDVVSETLARIYESQRYFAEAAEVYDKLADQKPHRAAEFQEKATKMRSRITGET